MTKLGVKVGDIVVALLVCDNCGKVVQLNDESDDIPSNWHAVRVDRWVGEFHACSKICEQGVKYRYSCD